MRRRAALQLLVYNCDLYVKALRPGVSIPALTLLRTALKSKLWESLQQKQKTSLTWLRALATRTRNLDRAIPAPQFKTLWASFEINYRPA